MRITPVHGDLPVIVTGPPPLKLGDQPPPATPVLARADAVGGADADATSDRRRAPAPKTCFDPPLIAQRAVLGLPVGPQIADLALAEGISYAAASAAVDREMPAQRQPGREPTLPPRTGGQATMPCGSMTYFLAAPLSKSA